MKEEIPRTTQVWRRERVSPCAPVVAKRGTPDLGSSQGPWGGSGVAAAELGEAVG